MEELNEMIEGIGIIPIDSSKNKSILVIDINYLPPELKGQSYVHTKTTLESLYGHSVILIDSSRQNLEGADRSNYKPIYFI